MNSLMITVLTVSFFALGLHAWIMSGLYVCAKLSARWQLLAPDNRDPTIVFGVLVVQISSWLLAAYYCISFVLFDM